MARYDGLIISGTRRAKICKKTLAVALVCRKDMIGYQIKAKASYLQSGEDYDQACRGIAPLHPERKIKGLIVLHPTEVHDIAPTKNTEEEVQKLNNTEKQYK